MANTDLVLSPIHEQLKMLGTKLLEPCLTVDYWTSVQQHRSFNTLQGPNNLQLAFGS